jgi:hypothetical protein
MTKDLKIGIYGDSFAAPNLKSPEKDHWYNMLGKMLGATQVDSYGVVCSSAYFSYKHFLKNYKNYDINIFILTSPHRYTKELWFKCIPNDPRFFNSYDSIDHFTKTQINNFGLSLTQDESESLNNLKGWFLSSHDEFNIDVQNLIVADILNKCPTAIIIPAFPDSLSSEDFKRFNIAPNATALEFTYSIGHFFGVKLSDYNERADRISCHFTPEVSMSFAASLFSYIRNNTTFERPKSISHRHAIDYYYDKK